MIIIGSEFVPYERPQISDFTRFNLEKKSNFMYIKNKAEAVMANANGVGFLVCENISFARQLQAIANDYLFDSKIALIIKDDDELNDAIDARIDAVIYKSLIY